MNTDRPRIAIPEPTSTDAAYNQRSLPQYIGAIESAGGSAVVVGLKQQRAAQLSLLATCAGILLPGSPADVDPHRYGQTPLEACAPKDAAREATDDLFLENASVTGKPLLGICFGLQSLNVWRHGTLIQDLPPSTTPATVNHEPGRKVVDAHAVVVSAGSRLASILAPGKNDGGGLAIQVNSSHHQAIDHPGDALQVVARSPQDGVIEAVEATSPDSFLVAVQWHPERSYAQSPASQALFTAFLDAARAWAASSATETPATHR